MFIPESRVMFYYIISTKYQKIGGLFCRFISGLSHSVIEECPITQCPRVNTYFSFNRV